MCTDDAFSKTVVVHHDDGSILQFAYASMMRLQDPDYLYPDDLAALRWYEKSDELDALDPDRDIDFNEILGEEPHIARSEIGWLIVFSEHNGTHVFACGDLADYAQYERVYGVREFPIPPTTS